MGNANGRPRQHVHTITRGFEKFAFPKLVRVLGSGDLVLKQKGLLGAAELLATGAYVHLLHPRKAAIKLAVRNTEAVSGLRI